MSDERNPGKVGFDALSKQLEAKLAGSSDDLTANGEVNELTDDGYMNIIRKSSTSFVMFYRTVCPYCKQLMPILEELADDYETKVMFAKVNLELVEEVQRRFDILGVPVVMAFKKGNLVGRIEGLRGIDEYDTWIDSIHKGLRPMGIDAGPTTNLQ